MQYTAGFSGQLSPDAVLARINEALYEEFTREKNPSYLSATDSMFFQQGPTVGAGFIWDEDSNVGAFQETGELEQIVSSNTFVGNSKTVLSQKWTKRIAISDEAFRADMIGKRAQIGKNVGDRARMTRDREALLRSYGDSFAGSINTTPDGQPLASNSHVALGSGATVDNLETGSLTPDNLWTGVNSLANQRAQDGDAGGHLFEGFLTNFNLYKTAKEVMGSPLVANSGENNLNIFETEYGEVQIRASIFLNTQYNTATNAATSFHLIGRNHQVIRKEFYGLTTSMLGPEYTDNDAHLLTSKYHEVVFPGSWTGYVGHNGTT